MGSQEETTCILMIVGCLLLIKHLSPYICLYMYWYMLLSLLATDELQNLVRLTTWVSNKNNTMNLGGGSPTFITQSSVFIHQSTSIHNNLLPVYHLHAIRICLGKMRGQCTADIQCVYKKYSKKKNTHEPKG